MTEISFGVFMEDFQREYVRAGADSGKGTVSRVHHYAGQMLVSDDEYVRTLSDTSVELCSCHEPKGIDLVANQLEADKQIFLEWQQVHYALTGKKPLTESMSLFENNIQYPIQ